MRERIFLTTCNECGDPLSVSAVTCGPCCAKTPSIGAVTEVLGTGRKVSQPPLETDDLLACIALRAISGMDSAIAGRMVGLIADHLVTKFGLEPPSVPESPQAPLRSAEGPRSETSPCRERSSESSLRTAPADPAAPPDRSSSDHLHTKEGAAGAESLPLDEAILRALADDLIRNGPIARALRSRVARSGEKG